MMTNTNNSNHDKYYRASRAYDVAFSWRNVGQECDFLINVTKRHIGYDLTHFLELAAGPADHTIEMARRRVKSVALDISQAMRDYSLAKAMKYGVEIGYHVADMVNFDLPEDMHDFDLAVLLMSSCSYLLTNDMIYSHLKSVAKHLKPGGLYLLEMPHPRDVFHTGSSVQTDWTCEQDGMKVHTIWGNPDDAFDPISFITQCSVKVTITEFGRQEIIEDIAQQRGFLATEFDALVRASGVFEIEAWYGAMNIDIPFTNRKESWRMVPVLKKL